MRPVPVFPDYLVKLVIPASRAILKPAVVYRFVSLFTTLLIRKRIICGRINFHSVYRFTSNEHRSREVSAFSSYENNEN